MGLKLQPPYISEPILGETTLFRAIQDPKHQDNSYHYTAWIKNDVRSLVEVRPEMIEDLLVLKQQLMEKGLIRDNTIIYFHYPPDYWRLHAHFVESNHHFRAPRHEIFLLTEVRKCLGRDPDYFLKNTRIEMEGREGELRDYQTWLL